MINVISKTHMTTETYTSRDACSVELPEKYTLIDITHFLFILFTEDVVVPNTN